MSDLPVCTPPDAVELWNEVKAWIDVVHGTSHLNRVRQWLVALYQLPADTTSVLSAVGLTTPPATKQEPIALNVGWKTTPRAVLFRDQAGTIHLATETEIDPSNARQHLYEIATRIRQTRPRRGH